MITEQDIHYLERAVSLAEKGLAEGNDPFGSVLVSADGTILAEDYNRVSSGDVTKHPEIELVRFASVHLNQEERHQSTVYTSGEHCPMCASLMRWQGWGELCTPRHQANYVNGSENSGVRAQSSTRCRFIK
ncbi:hypothetical protein JCM19037_2351 [Geomicrobium sp. JCM 19037]|uniref:nucleoside deaminase n=1 Tax=Geomicrobium sp. JCM 19037 TaxID=1460634 RepID=UPI00045F43A6|nr:nucleoside deaminase [Geomicrobium sp. JCM 19037]GAK03982.1 hypothetical protein JCM19037_2351 [Geomicrobium sp. JCM 19037]